MKALKFLEGGGEASRMIRERDWTGHPLGPPEGWAPELKSALSLVLNSPESMILSWGPELSFFFNETYFPLLGPRLPWAMGERFDKVWADGWAQAKPIIDAAYRGESQRFIDLPWKLGEDRGAHDTWWTFSYSRVLDSDGEIAGLFILTNETTARVLGDAALRVSEERYRLAGRATNDAIWDWDLVADDVHWNEALEAAYGHRPDQVAHTGEWWLAHIHADDRARIDASIHAVIDGRDTSWSNEYRFERSDGTFAFVADRGFVIRDEGGRALRMIGAMQDVSQRAAADRRNLALINLGDRHREAASSEEVVGIASEILGETLSASRAGYSRIDLHANLYEVEQDWVSGDVAHLKGRYELAYFSATVGQVKSGTPLVVTDIDKSDVLAQDRGAYRSISTRSLINVPLIERGSLVGSLYIHQTQPRAWGREEIAFARRVAERTYSALTRLKGEADQQLLNHELSHRLKNTLAMVQAIAVQTLRSVPDRAPVESFEKRLFALSSAHNVLLEQSWTSTRIRDVVLAVLEGIGETRRFELSGPNVALGPRTTLSLALLLHELGTNAIKYGSLSVDQGTVSLTWERTAPSGEGDFQVVWMERGGPAASPPARRGFGSRLINLGLVGTGGVSLHFAALGLSATMRAHLDTMQKS